MKATVKQMWLTGVSSGWWFVLSCHSCAELNRLPLGKTPTEARLSVLELNSRRQQLGLELIEAGY
jgi:hypothetical protein